MQAIREAIYTTIRAHAPMTVRQVFYQMVSQGVVDKTEGEYKSTVCRLLAEMRRASELPYSWIADNTRWMRKPRTYDDLEDFLEGAWHGYRRALWNNQDAYVEVWLEKEALAGVLVDVTDEWDVPLMVTRGYPSLSFLHAAAQAHARQTKPVHLYYFGDHDPSGKDIPRFVDQALYEMAPNVDVRFEVVAVNHDQIAAYDLPSRPTKRSDTRAKGWKGGSVELDAIDPDTLRELTRQRIEQHIDHDALDQMRIIETEERDGLARLVEDYGGRA